jgi:hypothetical protein
MEVGHSIERRERKSEVGFLTEGGELRWVLSIWLCKCNKNYLKLSNYYMQNKKYLKSNKDAFGNNAKIKYKPKVYGLFHNYVWYVY